MGDIIFNLSCLYARNLDRDVSPWCMIFEGNAVVKHYCDIPQCQGII